MLPERERRLATDAAARAGQDDALAALMGGHELGPDRQLTDHPPDSRDQRTHWLIRRVLPSPDSVVPVERA